MHGNAGLGTVVRARFDEVAALRGDVVAVDVDCGNVFGAHDRKREGRCGIAGLELERKRAVRVLAWSQTQQVDSVLGIDDGEVLVAKVQVDLLGLAHIGTQVEVIKRCIGGEEEVGLLAFGVRDDRLGDGSVGSCEGCGDIRSLFDYVGLCRLDGLGVRRKRVPGDALAVPACVDERCVFVVARRKVVGTCDGVGVVLPVNGNTLGAQGGVPADALVIPADAYKVITLVGGQRVVVIARVGVVEAKDGLIACGGCHPADTLVAPTDTYQMIALDLTGGVEVLA